MVKSRGWMPLVVVCAGLMACAPGDEGRDRVLVIGIDGASWRVIEPMLQSGRLPHLARLAENGASGELRSFFPLLSPRVWTSMATGKRPAKHGVLGWVRPGHAGETRLYDSHDRMSHALWNIVSAAGLDVVVINWLMTYPPEPIRGVMVSDHTFPDEVEGQRAVGQMFADAQGDALQTSRIDRAEVPVVYPREWLARVRAGGGAGTAPGAVPDPFAGLAENATWHEYAALSRVYDRDLQLARLALEIEAEVEPDVLMLLLQGIDRVSHFMWRTLDDPATYPPAYRRPESDRDRGREALLGYYEFTDGLIGQLVEAFDDDSLVLIVSDHGFEGAAEFPRGRHDTEQARDGVIFARGKGIAAGGEARGVSILDVTPAVLAWLDLPAGLDMDGRVPEFLDVSPPPPVASHDVDPVPRLARGASGAEDERLDGLRALGYID